MKKKKRAKILNWLRKRCFEIEDGKYKIELTFDELADEMQTNYAFEKNCAYCGKEIKKDTFVFVSKGKSHINCVPDNVFSNYLYEGLDKAKYEDYINGSSCNFNKYIAKLRESNLHLKNKTIEQFLKENIKP